MCSHDDEVVLSVSVQISFIIGLGLLAKYILAVIAYQGSEAEDKEKRLLAMVEKMVGPGDNEAFVAAIITSTSGTDRQNSNVKILHSNKMEVFDPGSMELGRPYEAATFKAKLRGAIGLGSLVAEENESHREHPQGPEEHAE